MSEGKKLYTVKWPRGEGHVVKSSSGIHVERNTSRQLALHFYNETRAMEPEVEYLDDGSRVGEDREITYLREVTDTILISESSAWQLRDFLNTIYPPPTPEQIN